MDYKSASGKIINWISQTVYSAGFNHVIIGLSGGIDSALSTTLSTRAMGKERVIVVMLPYGNMHDEHVKDAITIADFLDIPRGNRVVIDIKPAVATLWKDDKDDIRLGNIMARVRMIYLFDLAKKLRALVCGTENKTEHYLGYFTRFGDNASDIEPIVSLYKTDVREMAKNLGIPEKVITKDPTAALWEGQTDEGELGFTYADADKVLAYFIDQKLSREEIIAKGIAEDVVTKVIKRVQSQDFKHHLPHMFVLE